MMTNLERLTRTRALITDSKHFTQGVMARDSAGDRCGPRGNEARSWCVIGAWMRVTGNVPGELAKLCNDVEPVIINDGTGHEAVLTMLDDAIERAQND